MFFFFSISPSVVFVVVFSSQRAARVVHHWFTSDCDFVFVRNFVLPFFFFLRLVRLYDKINPWNNLYFSMEAWKWNEDLSWSKLFRSVNLMTLEQWRKLSTIQTRFDSPFRLNTVALIRGHCLCQRVIWMLSSLIGVELTNLRVFRSTGDWFDL